VAAKHHRFIVDVKLPQGATTEVFEYRLGPFQTKKSRRPRLIPITSNGAGFNLYLTALGRKPTHRQGILRWLTLLRYCVGVPDSKNKGSNGGSSIELAARSAI
jgi:hypothetical protein